MAEVGFDLKRLYGLSRSKYGVSQVRSVLLCFTDVYPGERPGVVDVARAGEAWRLASHRPAQVLREQLEQHGLGEYVPVDQKDQKRKPLRPRTPGRAAVGWALVLLLVVFQALLGILDLGVGMVIGGIGLIVGWLLPVRRLVYGRRPAPRAVKVAYVLGALALSYATASTGAVAVMALGTHGVAHIAYEETGTGSHGTQYKQCYLDLPDNNTEQLRTTGACPAPDGTAVDAYYEPGGDSPLLPVLADSASMERAGLVWGLPAALGLGLFGYTMVASLHGLERRPARTPEPTPRSLPKSKARFRSRGRHE
ncbi:hypothetical protein [Kitasatospora kifunensis]|uniref:DUF3592 domain-containing protein n=1 Tax=Kitasatospora kifunensis TaxID=58351 RepID=A0A7W7VY19_KITKI|nr:hypothetical protein [Kitasatospora kifunensis]MBB4926219.1 hypothetical protein [Kitasatospora kifunensis]